MRKNAEVREGLYARELRERIRVARENTHGDTEGKRSGWMNAWGMDARGMDARGMDAREMGIRGCYEENDGGRQENGREEGGRILIFDRLLLDSALALVILFAFS
jgi:hypothetical protein